MLLICATFMTLNSMQNIYHCKKYLVKNNLWVVTPVSGLLAIRRIHKHNYCFLTIPSHFIQRKQGSMTARHLSVVAWLNCEGNDMVIESDTSQQMIRSGMHVCALASRKLSVLALKPLNKAWCNCGEDCGMEVTVCKFSS